MNRPPLRNLVPFWPGGLMLMVCAVVWLFHLLDEKMHGVPLTWRLDSELARSTCWLAICAALAFHALRRAREFNPLLHVHYGEWLRRTPWEPGRPLPFGPIELCLADLPVLAGFALVRWCCLGAQEPAWPAMAQLGCVFLIPFLLFQCLIVLRHRVLGWLMLTAIPMTFYPLCNWYMALAVLVVIDGMTVIATREAMAEWSLRGLPEGVDFYRRVLYARAKVLCRSPILNVAPELFPRGESPVWRKVLGCFETGWWIFAGTSLLLNLVFWADPRGRELQPFLMSISQDPSFQQKMIFLAAVAGEMLAGPKLLACLVGTWPSTSLLGRVLSGRLIIPGYDRVFVGPAVAMVVSAFVTKYLLITGAPFASIPAAIVTIACLLLIFLPPKAADFRLTAPLRYLSTNRQTRSNLPPPKQVTIRLHLPGEDNDSPE